MRRFVFPSVGFAILLGSLSLVPAQRTLSPRVFAITGARVVGHPGLVLAGQTLVIRDGLIDDIGAEVRPPADAIVINGKGLTVYPGFLDAGSDWGFDSSLRRSGVGEPAAEDLAAESLAVTKPDNRKGLTPEFLVRSALRTDTDANEGWRRVGLTSHLVAPSSGILLGQSALVSLSGAAPRDAVLASPVAQHLSFRSSGGTGYPRVLMGVVAHARQTFLDAGHHARLLRAYEAAGRIGKRIPADPSLEALVPVLEGKMPLVMEADSRDEIDRALSFAAEFKMKPILFGGRDAWKVADRLARERVPVILRLDFTDPGSPAAQVAGRDTPARVKDQQQRLRDEEVRGASVLAGRGVAFAFASQGLPAENPWDRFQTNLRKTIAEGLRPDDALEALTRGAARILGVEKQLGSVSKGKAAHLIVTDGDWNLSSTRVKHVFVDGAHFEPEPRTTPAGKKPTKPKKPAVLPRDDQTCELDEDRKPATRTGGNVLLRGATVLPVSREPMPATDVLVRDGKIAAIGKGLEAPEGVKVIDLTGLFVMPGIIDTHCHFAVSGGVNEFSLSVVPEVRIRDAINSEDVQIYRALAGGVTTARLLHGSANVIGGQDAVIKLRYGKPAGDLVVNDGPIGVKFALGENVKRTDGRFPNTRLGVEAVLVRSFTEAREYARIWDAHRKGKTTTEPRRDLRLEALADVLAGKIKVHCHCYRADEILMLLRVADRFGVKVQSLQHVLEGYKVAPEIARHGASCSPFSDWWAYKWEAADAIPHCAALLHEAGVSVCLKSDSNELMRHMYQEAAKLLKYGGLSEREALATITLNGARQLGLDKRIGSIERGKDADLAVFNGHPLNSYSRVEMTLVDGEVAFERADRKPFALAAPAPDKPAARALVLPRGKLSALVNATVHPVSGPAREKMTIEIREGKIVRIRDTTPMDRKMPDALDVSGLHVYPGMIDAGTVLGLIEVDSARETRDHAEGGDFQPDLLASTAINPDSELIPVTRANGVLSVVTRPTGGVIAGQGALVNLAGWVPGEMAVVDPLALHVELPGGVPGIGRGSPFGMASRGVARKTREAKLRRLRELFNQALVHERARKERPDTPANPRLEALAPYARGAKPVIIQASRTDEIREALALGEALKLKLILAGGIDAWKVAGELKKRDVPVILGPVLALPSERHDPYDAPFASAAKLHAAGVRFCIRSTGDSNTRNLPYHAAMAVSYGLPAAEGLKAVTLYPARILGVADRLGSIEEGKQANLVIATGDLLQASTQVLGVCVAGKALPATSKHTRLYERYRERLREVKGAR